MYKEMSKADVELQVEIEQLLYYEARLLDENRRYEWLDLFTEDAIYRMPVRESVQGSRQQAGSNQVIVNDDLAFDLINDDKKRLEIRVKRLDTGLAHVEQPESITSRIVSNVEVEGDEGADQVFVRSNFSVVVLRQERSRDMPHDHFLGKREDKLRKQEGQWKIAERKVILAQPLLDRAISILL